MDEIDEASAVSKITDDEDLIKRLGKWESESKQHWAKWRREGSSAYKFVAGEQWLTDDAATLSDEGRVAIVFNRIDPMVSAVLGAEILNRQEVTYLPREMGDVNTNEILNDAAQWVRDSSDAANEESDAFLDLIITGLGWTETRMDYEEDPEGMIVIERVSPMQMWPDPSARKRGLQDRRYHWRGRDMDPHDVKSMFPTKYEEVINAGNNGDGADVTVSETSARDDYQYGMDESGGGSARKKIWVRHFQWYDLVDSYRVIDPDSGQSSLHSGAEYKSFVKEYIAMGVRPPQAAKIKTRQYMEAFVAGNVLLKKQEIEGFTFHVMTGKRDEGAGTWYGVVRAMMDPQRWANKWFSQIMHILNTSAKGGLMYEDGAFVDPRKALDEWSRPDGAIRMAPGALARGAVQERKSANYPSGIDKLMQFSFDAMPQVSGINLEMMGLVGKDQPGVLEAHRKQAGYAILAQFFDALKLYRKRQGRTLLTFIQHYLSDGRLIRVTGRDGIEQYLPLIRNDETMKYDVIVDDAPMSPNQKQTVWAMVMQMMPMLKDAPLPGEVWADMLKYSPLPAALSAKIGQAISQGGEEEPDPAQQAMMQAQQEQAQAATAKDASQAQLNAARAAEAQAEAQQTQAETATGLF